MLYVVRCWYRLGMKLMIWMLFGVGMDVGLMCGLVMMMKRRFGSMW